MIVWVIGAGGLFGSAVVRAAHSRGWMVFPGSAIPWREPDQSVAAIRSDAQRFVQTLQPEQRWGIVWAAGHATTSSTAEETEVELSVFTRCATAISYELGAKHRGSFLLASSAGGIYAGSENPPFDSQSSPQPSGAYGRLKRDQEISAEQILASTMDVTIARLANLYGPGQDLGKLQGLISRLALAAITKQTLTMFVPLDTLRDFIHVDNAAQVSLEWLTDSSSACQVRVIATGHSTSLGFIINQMKDIARTRIPVAYGMHPSAGDQAHDLRLIPDSLNRASPVPITALPAGMKAVFDDILYRHQEASSLSE